MTQEQLEAWLHEQRAAGYSDDYIVKNIPEGWCEKLLIRHAIDSQQGQHHTTITRAINILNEYPIRVFFKAAKVGTHRYCASTNEYGYDFMSWYFVPNL